MANLEEHEVEIIRRAAKVFAIELGKPGTLGDVPEFESLEHLSDYLDALDSKDELDESFDVSYEALRDLSRRLAEGHREAAEVSVGKLKKEEVEPFLEGLEDLHEDIQDDVNLRAALKLIDGLAKVTKDRLANSG